MTLKGVAFDLDGVLTDTARAHYRAWKKLADSLGIPFDEERNEALKGVDRMGSLALILGDRPAYDLTERQRLAARKNDWYLEEIAHFGPADLFPGARAALEQCRAAGLGIALASASRNAPLLIARMQVADLFDAVIDPASLAAGKPAPDIFLAAAAVLGVDPAAMLGVEDAPAGVQAIHAAGMKALGVGTRAALPDVDWIIPAIRDFDLAAYSA
ncbi:MULTISPECIES: beta-phosphoglucomutase [unclassified Sphingomonas]|uniref:beta-phosphoglucomutase n=1 Tax=Sphingomonas TaxID=13687 RepID=UPI00095F4BD4|nr:MULTISPECIES: beta-phosphoglucomutase [unclassified Sphingomonas]MBN8813598.1 beta-phosphoglucomutase [Sphingomonas sp.]OJY52319.1 MAG: beta-phosphoglucomutase [Sphingomonas sp. 67-41]